MICCDVTVTLINVSVSVALCVTDALDVVSSVLIGVARCASCEVMYSSSLI